MTVVHIIEPFASGVTTAVINITRQLRDVNHVVVHGSRMWVDTQENVKSKFPPGVTFIPWRHAGREINPKNDFLALIHLIRILKGYREAVIHLHSSKAGFLGRLACGLTGNKKVLYTPHCPAFIRTDISDKKRRFYQLLEKTAARLGGHIVGCGKSEAELFRKMGIPARYVANGVAPRPEDPQENREHVSFVGIANHQKNPALFSTIAASFQDTATPFRWVGDGELKDDLKAKNIELTGWVGKEEVEGYLKETLVYLSTSGWEGLPFGVLEAMNLSCALLLKDVPGNRDLVEPGRNGHLFTSAGEAVARLEEMLNDPAKTRAMGRESRKMVEEQFSLKQMGEGYLAVYRSMVS